VKYARFWQRHWVHLLLILASIVPLLYPTIPPLVDLPGHMGRYQVELNYDHVPVLHQYYQFQWQLIGNLGVDLLIIPVATVFGLELGVKLIVIAILALTVSGMLWIAREVHGKVTPTALFALPFAYGHPFMFGFINYALAMALALNAFALWLRLERMRRYRARAITFLCLSPLLWLCHIYGWAALCLLAASAEIVHQHDRRGKWLLAVMHAAFQCLSLAPPLILMALWRGSGHVSGKTFDWFHWTQKALWYKMILRDHWRGFDEISVYAVSGLIIAVLVATLCAYALSWFSRPAWRWLRDPKLTFSRNLAASALILLAAFLILPRVVFGSAYADMRLTSYILAIALIGIRLRPNAGPKLRAGLMIAGLAFFAARTVGTTISFWQSAQVYNRALKGLDYVPEGARLVSFVGHDCHTLWMTNRLEHVPAMAIVRRNAFSNDQWNMEGAQLLLSRYPEGMGYAGHYRGDPSQIVLFHKCRGEFWRTLNYALINLPRDKFDYVWMLDPPRFDRKNLKGLTLLWRDGTDAVYRVDDRTQPGHEDE
jgi:hypothetical protein